MKNTTKTLWELLWDYDPNGLVVLDPELKIQVTNPAFCRMVRKTHVELVNVKIEDLLGDSKDFKTAWNDQIEFRGVEKYYPELELYVRKVIFPIPDQNLIACIMVDLTHEMDQKTQMNQVKAAAIQELSLVVDKQMHVAQQIAGLLGETTAETKVGLLKLLEMLKKENFFE